MRSASSAVNTVISYATFFTLSVALHLVVILGTRPAAEPDPEPPAAAARARQATPERRARTPLTRGPQSAARLDRADVGGGLE